MSIIIISINLAIMEGNTNGLSMFPYGYHSNEFSYIKMQQSV
jgi:hypothetical protein